MIPSSATVWLLTASQHHKNSSYRKMAENPVSAPPADVMPNAMDRANGWKASPLMFDLFWFGTIFF